MTAYNHIKKCFKILEEQKLLEQHTPMEILSIVAQFSTLINLARLCEQITEKQATYLRKKLGKIHFASLEAVSGTI